jgi:hypothetical protein
MMKEQLYYPISLTIIIGLPILLSFYMLAHIYFITLISLLCLLVVLVLDSERPYNLYYAVFVGFLFTIVLLLLINSEAILALQVASNMTFTGLHFTTLSIDNPLQWWTGGQITGNGIIAMCAIIFSLIFWLLGLVGLRTKKVLQGIVIFVGAIFFIECFYAFIAPEQAASTIGWYNDAKKYLPKIGQDWLLVPYRFLAIMEYLFLAYNTVGMATVICVAFLFINDFIATKTGIKVGRE